MVDQVGSIAITVEADVGPLTRGMASADQSLSQTERQVEKLRRSIEKYGQTSTELQKQIDGMVGSQTRLEKSARESAAAFESFDRARASVDALRASVDPMFAASKRFEAAVVQLDAALEMGAISASQHAAMVDQLGNAYLRVQPRVGALSAGMAATSGMSGQLRSQLQGVGYQIQDFAVQVGAGTSATQAFAQQFPQLASAFGPVGVAIGTLAAIGVPLLVAAFSSASAEATALEQAMKAVGDAAVKTQVQIDKLRFGVDEEYQVELLREQVRLRDQHVAKTAELNNYLATTTDSLDRQRIKSAQIAAEIGGIVAEYNKTAAALARQQQLATTLAVIDGVRIQRANEIKAKQEQTAVAAELLTRRMNAAYAAYAASRTAAAGLASETERAASAAAQFAYNMQLASTGQSSGPDSVRSGLGGGGVFTPVVRGAGLAGASGSGGGGGGGGGGENPLIAELETLRESFLSQEEIQLEAYASQQEKLEAALSQKLLTQQEYLALMEQAQQAHADKMSAIDVYRYGDGAQKAAAYFGVLADTFQSGSDRMQKIARVAGAAEALINAWRAYNQVLADPRLPFGAKFAAGAAVLSAGLKAVQAIKSGNTSGGASGGGATPATAVAAAPAQTPLDVRLSLSGPGSDDLGGLLDKLSGLAGDRGMRLLVAR